MKKGILALSCGTFCFGMSEFIMMSILPDVASTLGISITVAGHLISAYALGVCVGAPLIAIVSRNFPLRTILQCLMLIMVAGSLLAAASQNYTMALCARFITGLPHGAFFGVGSIVANRLAKEGKGTLAISLMTMGMTVANLIGVPVGNYLSHEFSWRLIFMFNAVCGLTTLYTVRRCVPELPPMPATSIRGLFGFLKQPAPWFMLLAIVFGNSSIFCWYSYVNPFMTEVAGIDVNTMPLLMLLSGGSMFIGNLIGGNLSDRFSPNLVAACTQCVALFAMTTLLLFPYSGVVAIMMMCLATGSMFCMSAPQQQLLLRNSHGSEMMGGALSQVAFNLGNAFGAYAGGLTIEHTGLRYVSMPGAVFALIGTSLLFAIYYRRSMAKSVLQLK